MERNPYPILHEIYHGPIKRPNQTDTAYRKSLVSWHHGLTPQQQTINDILREQVFGLLDITSAGELRPLMDQPDERRQTSELVLDRLGSLYGIQGPEMIRQKFRDYGGIADSVIDYMQGFLSYPGSTNLEMVNEIRAYNDPTDLLLVTMNGRWSDKAAFEAKRKLQLMALAGSIDRREREIGTEDQFKRFVNWLHERVWNPDLLIGESKDAFLISDHDPQTWACIATRIVDEAQGTEYELQPFQRKTDLPRRNFLSGRGTITGAYVTIREKTTVAKTLKMLRKGVEDPAIAVDDDTGLLVVLENRRDVREFTNHLIRQGYQSGHPIITEDISDTLDGGEYNNRNGGSRKLRMMKFFIRLANEMRIECIIHTPDTYAEYLYARVISHQEYELDRLFGPEINVPRLLFPEKYFPKFDMEIARQTKHKQIREEIEGSQTPLITLVP